MDLYQIWFRGSSRGRNQLCVILLQSTHGLRFCEGSNFAISRSTLTWPVAVNTVLAQPVIIIIINKFKCKHLTNKPTTTSNIWSTLDGYLCGIAARCYALTRPVPSCAMSACPSPRVFCQNEHFHNFYTVGSHTILFFSAPYVMAILRRRPPLTGALNAGGVGKNRDFRRI